jgi:hypothetical protein
MGDCGATRENVAEMRVGRRVAHALLLRVSLVSSRIVAATREYRRRRLHVFGVNSLRSRS